MWLIHYEVKNPIHSKNKLTHNVHNYHSLSHIQMQTAVQKLALSCHHILVSVMQCAHDLPNMSTKDTTSKPCTDSKKLTRIQAGKRGGKKGGGGGCW